MHCFPWGQTSFTSRQSSRGLKTLVVCSQSKLADWAWWSLLLFAFKSELTLAVDLSVDVSNISILDDLENFVGPKFKPIVDLFRSLANIHDLCRSPVLDSNFESVIQEFTLSSKECFDVLGLSKTLKMHIISDHLGDYFKLINRKKLYFL